VKPSETPIAPSVAVVDPTQRCVAAFAHVGSTRLAGLRVRLLLAMALADAEGDASHGVLGLEARWF
jgi:predicted dinucleotide-binding enzyme